ncbi:GDSL-like Lipase/Acylhydrolase family protein [Friedmanniella luteola]|uniref:GDSL-like Lipase/Acylhydrolase family protein n=1 Tax=Friedmanniella luteola TaxID=546871 RepID=A0A1H1LCT9_9ACTN|nr:SGNH/GDSL hydrolase family protein [Friedmanniella luteola]SDR71679.1 GDSL-like Lipase/Acylhydrolase family protein [Friedmanniella luteola]
MRPTTRRSAVLAAAAVLLALVSPPAQAASGSYVALGDSYASGTGTGRYLGDGTSCQRSVYAYPALVAASRGLALNFRACSGATTADVAALQLGALSGATTHASISVGGNDAGFAAVLTECAKPAWASHCNAAVDRARDVVNGRLPGRLAALFSALRGRAPRAEVVVLGYPRIFNGEDCNAFTWFSPAEQARLNALADLLDARLAAAAAEAGLLFRSPVPAFDGHAVCDRPAWLNGLSRPVAESFHPNRAGHASGQAPLVGSALTGSWVAVSPATVRAAEASAAPLAARQRRYAAQDRTITPQRFAVPDLGSPAIRRAAARAGVRLSSRASIDAADRRYSAQQARARGDRAPRPGREVAGRAER